MYHHGGTVRGVGELFHLLAIAFQDICPDIKRTLEAKRIF
jgi:hypothetical protein